MTLSGEVGSDLLHGFIPKPKDLNFRFPLIATDNYYYLFTTTATIVKARFARLLSFLTIFLATKHAVRNLLNFLLFSKTLPSGKVVFYAKYFDMSTIGASCQSFSRL